MNEKEIREKIIGKTIMDMEIFRNNEYYPDTFCLRRSLATIKLIFSDESKLTLGAENATNYDLEYISKEENMKTCEKCKYFTIEPTGFDNPYVLLCDKCEDKSIYLGHVESVNDIDDTFEICEYYEEERE